MRRGSKWVVFIGTLWWLTTALWVHAAELQTSASESRNQVTIQLKWKHQYQFAGYYAAIAQGYYADEGLDVVLLEGGGRIDPIEVVQSGSADYGISDSSLIIDFPNKDPLVALAAIFQHSPYVILTLPESGIYEPQDLVGRRLGLPQDMPLEAMAMIVASGLQPEQLELQTPDDRLKALIDGELDAILGYRSASTWLLDKQFINYNIITPGNFGVDFYGDVLFTRLDRVERNSDEAVAIRRATLRGWEYALKYPEKTISLMRNEFGITTPSSALRYEARVMRDLILPGIVNIGYMNRDRWQAIQEVYQQWNPDLNFYDLDNFMFDPLRYQESEWVSRMWQLALLLVLLTAVLAIGAAIYYRGVRQTIQEKQEDLADTQLKLSQSILERERSREALQESRRRLSTLMDNIIGLVYRVEVSEGLPLRYVSEGCYELTGYTAHELIYDSKLKREDLIHKDDYDRVSQEIKHAIKNQETHQSTYRIITQSGKEKWVLDQSQPVFDANHRVVALEGLLTDITRLKRIERELALHKTQLEALVQERTNQLEERIRFEELIAELSTQFISAETSELQQLIEMSLEQLGRTMNVDRCFVYLLNEERHQMQLESYWHDPSSPLENIDQVRNIDVQKFPWIKHQLENLKCLGIDRIAELPTEANLLKQLFESRGIKSIAVAPLVFKGALTGAVLFSCLRSERQWKDFELMSLRLVGEMLSSAVERYHREQELADTQQKLLRTNKELERLAKLDGLTNIANRRHFNQTLEYEVRRGEREGDYLSLLICDVDFFKNYNDYYGHLPGDDCLKRVAQILTHNFQRAADLCARYGGEEFAVIMPGVNAEEASISARRLLDSIRSANLPHQASEVADHVTLSIGVATARLDGTHSAQSFILAADNALYRAKQKGRNRVEIANDNPGGVSAHSG